MSSKLIDKTRGITSVTKYSKAECYTATKETIDGGKPDLTLGETREPWISPSKDFYDGMADVLEEEKQKKITAAVKAFEAKEAAKEKEACAKDLEDPVCKNKKYH